MSLLKSPAKSIIYLIRHYSKNNLPIPTSLSIHAYFIKTKSKADSFSYNLIISSHIHANQLGIAHKLFEEMPERNVITYTLLIDAHMKCGHVIRALNYFVTSPFESVVFYTATINGLVRNDLKFEAFLILKEMICKGLLPNEMTFTTIISSCEYIGNLKCFIGMIVKTNFEKNVSVCNSLISALSKMREVTMAKIVFNEMSQRDVISWTSLLDVYFEAGDMKGAHRLFDFMPVRNEISYSTMIARLSQNSMNEDALALFDRMIRDGYKPNTSCFASVLSASASCKRLYFGSSVHSLAVKFGLEMNCYVANSLIDMYSKCWASQDACSVFDLVMDKNIVILNSMLGGYFSCRKVELAEEFFKEMPEKNIVSWNSMISGYDLNERYADVLETYDEMLLLGILPTKMTFSSVLHSCANLPSLEKGMNIHGKVIKLGLEKEVFVGTALIDMYSKSGDIESSKKTFFLLPEKNEISWTVMIQALADCGFAKESINLFEKWKKSNMSCNETMLLSVLSACSHSGLVSSGLKYFEAMEKVHGITPNEKHYTCIVNLLSKAGHIEEAEEFIKNMPIKPESNTWAALLSGCCTYKKVDIGEKAAQNLRKGSLSSGYVLLANLYAMMGQWRKAARMRERMKDAGVKKGGACSWIQIKNRFHPFYSWDANHIESLKIYTVLKLLTSEMVKCDQNKFATD